MSTPRTGSIGVAPPTAVAPPRARLRRLSAVVGATVVRTPEISIGALAVVAVAVFSWVPSLWYDEAATVASARRSLPQLWAELHTVDAVHGLYYALMHVWFWLVGYTPFTLRLPSALAIGVAAGLVVALGRRIGGLRLGIVAGVVFVALPRVEWAGSEGRPYATITTLVVALTLVGLTAVRRTRAGSGTGWWVAYGVLAVLGVVFNVYMALAVVAHGAALLWTVLAQRAAVRRATLTSRSDGIAAPLVTRGVVGRWVVASGIAAVVLMPFVGIAAGQARQVGWIGPVTAGTIRQVFQTAWFGGSWWYAALAWALMIVALVVIGRAARRPHPTGRDLVRVQAVRVVLPLVVVPTALLVGATALGMHLYSPKYATLSLPFVAVLIALAITSIRPRALLAVAVGLCLVVSLPPAIATRTPHAKQDSYWANAAAIVAAGRSSAPDADEGVIYGSVWGHPTTTAQVVADAYPKAFAGMTDLAVRTYGADQGVLWNTNGDIATTVPARLGDIDTVWYVGSPARSIRPQVVTTLHERGFSVAQSWRVGHVDITEFVRPAG